MKIIKYFFEFISIISLFCIFKIIGLRNASYLGGIIGKVIGPLFRSKNIIKNNIEIAFGKIEENIVELLVTFSISLVTIFCKKSLASDPFTCIKPLSSRVMTSSFSIFANFESIIY